MPLSDGRLRLLLIAPTLEIIGGQAVQASRLLERLRAEDGIEVSFLPINPRLPAFIRKLKYVRTVVNFLVFAILLIRRAPSCDVMHVFTAAYSSYFLWTVPATVAGKLLGKKVIVNYRDGQGGDHLRRSRLAVATLRLPDAVVAPSDYLVDVFAGFGLRAVSIPNFIDAARFRFRDRTPLRPVFMTNRGLEPLYNVGCVLRAFALIQRSYPDASLTVAHDGPCRRELEALAAELQLRNVRFLGKVLPERIADLYDEADIYLTSPNVDNMPGSLLECFASGLPVIATKVGGIPYIVADGVTGFLVPPNDHAALAERALMLLENPAVARQIAARARAECAARYVWDAVRPQWLRLYEQLSGKTLAADVTATRLSSR
ncbi:MAG TPA: glycosyltransferase family 4 protein [Candidatus Acidoferrum sp.]|nr:glycosyltransferase family 4 protein [Candidatus Acidoferrum sp.]